MGKKQKNSSMKILFFEYNITLDKQRVDLFRDFFPVFDTWSFDDRKLQLPNTDEVLVLNSFGKDSAVSGEEWLKCSFTKSKASDPPENIDMTTGEIVQADIPPHKHFCYTMHLIIRKSSMGYLIICASPQRAPKMANLEKYLNKMVRNYYDRLDENRVMDWGYGLGLWTGILL